jgi:hypothetical protein
MKNNFAKGLIMSLVAFLATYISTNDPVRWDFVLITSVAFVLMYLGKNLIIKSNSEFLGVNLRDLFSGLLIAISMAISSFISSLALDVDLDYKALGMAVLLAVGGYLSKTLFSNSSGVVLSVDRMDRPINPPSPPTGNEGG